MGIKGLNSWITTTFPGVMVDAPSPRDRNFQNKSPAYDHVLIDANGLVHQSCRRCATENLVFRDVVARLDDVFRRYPPRCSALIALDGPGPHAKMLEQRSRRIHSVLKAERDKEAQIVGSAEYERRKALAAEVGRPWPPRAGRPRKPGLETLQVTPGTGFMLRLRRVLEWYAAERLAGGRAARMRSGHALAFVSGADVPGEGEIKLLEHLHDARDWGGLIGSGAPRFLLVGPDADLLLLGLAAGAPQCNVLTMDGHGKDKLFKVDVLRQHLASKFGGSGRVAGQHELDLLVMAFLQGNDYLPKLPGASMQRYLNALEKLLKEKCWRGQHLLNVRHGTIVELNLPLLIALTKASHKGIILKGGKNKSEKLDDADKTSDDIETPHGVKGGSNPSQYLTCLAWCAAMYLKGTCPDYTVVYQYKKSPTLSELAQFHDAKPALRPSYRIPTETKEGPLSASVFSLCLLPGAAQKYVPVPLQSLMDEGGSLSDIFHDANPSPANLVSRITEAVKAVGQTNWQEEDLLAVTPGKTLVFGSMQAKWHPFLRRSQTSLLPLQHMYLSSFGPGNKPLQRMYLSPFGPATKKTETQIMHSVGCVRIDANTRGTTLENWAWDSTTSYCEETFENSGGSNKKSKSGKKRRKKRAGTKQGSSMEPVPKRSHSMQQPAPPQLRSEPLDTRLQATFAALFPPLPPPPPPPPPSHMLEHSKPFPIHQSPQHSTGISQPQQRVVENTNAVQFNQQAMGATTDHGYNHTTQPQYFHRNDSYPDRRNNYQDPTQQQSHGYPVHNHAQQSHQNQSGQTFQQQGLQHQVLHQQTYLPPMQPNHPCRQQVMPQLNSGTDLSHLRARLIDTLQERNKQALKDQS